MSEAEYKNQTRASSGPMNDRIGALFTWDDGPSANISSKIGISFISSDRADSYKNTEITSWILSDTVDAARKEWNQDVFS